MCCDGLKGLPDAIRTTWPYATVQTCVVHMVRNSLRYASRAHWSRVTKAMRQIYGSARRMAFADVSNERYLASAVEAIDQSLLDCGAAPLGTNEDFAYEDTFPPAFRMVKEGVAPIRLQLYGDVNVWIGPLSEVLLVDALDQPAITAAVSRLLRSSIRLTTKRRKAQLSAWDDDGVWIDLGVATVGKSGWSPSDLLFAPAYPGLTR